LELKQLLSANSGAPQTPTITWSDYRATRVTFIFTGSETADSYDVWVDNRVTKETQVLRLTEHPDWSLTVSLGRRGRGDDDAVLPEGYYRIWVRATNNSGHSAWSTSEDFTLGDPPPLNPPASPAVTGPTGNNVSVRPTISWTAVEHADTYELWVDDLTSETEKVIWQDDINATSFDVTSALAAGTYRVWVRAANQAGHSKWSTGSDFTVPRAAEVPDQPSITDIQTQSSSVTVNWSESNTADSYDVWIDNRVTGEKQVVRLTEHLESSLQIYVGRRGRGDSGAVLPEGYYRIWVRGTNTAGHSAWSAAEDFTLGDPPPLNPPASPTFTGPMGNNVSVRPTISWTAVEHADTYELWVDDLTSETTKVIWQDDLNATSFDVTSALAAGTYRVWVRAANEAGNSAWSQAADFTVPLADRTPNAPTITDIQTQSSSVTVTWSESNAADSYDIWIDNRVSRELFVLRITEHLETSLTVHLGRRGRGDSGAVLPEGYYRIWVRATNTAGHSTWSAAKDFTLGDPPPLSPPASPTVTGPTGNDVSVRPTISWTAVEDADTYELWVDDLTSETTKVIWQDDLNATSYDVTSSLAAGTYRVWVRATNEAGHSKWSTGSDFTVPLADRVPSAPSITDIQKQASSVTIDWTAPTSADSYDVWVNNRVTGEQQVVRLTEHLETSLQVYVGRRGRGDNGALLPEGYYRIWVRATNTAGHSTWSSSADFTHGDPPPRNPPASPTVTGPTGNNVSVRPTLTWTAVEHADTYELWVDDLTSETTKVIWQDNLNATSYDVTSALAAGTYRVWVRAANEAGNSAWSQAADFTVPLADRVPNAPSITDIQKQSSSVTILWSGSDTADSYDIWIDNRDTGEQQVVRLTEHLETSLHVYVGRRGRGDSGAVLPEGSYRIWVRATNTAGHSAWSAFADFDLLT